MRKEVNQHMAMFIPFTWFCWLLGARCVGAGATAGRPGGASCEEGGRRGDERGCEEGGRRGEDITPPPGDLRGLG